MRRRFIIQEPEDFVIDWHPHKFNINHLFESDLSQYSKQSIILCPADALRIEGTSIHKTSDCFQCGLCDLKYYYNNKNTQTLKKPTVSDYFLSDIQRLCIVLKYSLGESLPVFCEVNVDGDFRNKRIDIVYRENSTIMILKALSNVDRYQYYNRSYDDIAKTLREKHPSFRIKIKLLVSSEHFSTLNTECDTICTIDRILMQGAC